MPWLTLFLGNDLQALGPKEEPRLKGMLTEVREILLAGTELAKAVGTLAAQFKPDPNNPKAPPGQPLGHRNG